MCEVWLCFTRVIPLIHLLLRNGGGAAPAQSCCRAIAHRNLCMAVAGLLGHRIPAAQILATLQHACSSTPVAQTLATLHSRRRSVAQTPATLRQACSSTPVTQTPAMLHSRRRPVSQTLATLQQAMTSCKHASTPPVHHNKPVKVACPSGYNAPVKGISGLSKCSNAPVKA